MSELIVDIGSVTYPEAQRPAISNIRLSVKSGEFIILTGTAESGKSTLCRAMTGIIPHFVRADIQGSVLFDGTAVADMRPQELAGKIGYVGEDAENSLFSTTIFDDVAFGPCNVLLEPDDIRRRVAEALEFTGLRGYEDRAPESLSGGQLQRAALASILSTEPEVLILDNATDQLDPGGKREIYDRLIARCRKTGMAVITVERPSRALPVNAARLLVLDRGTPVYDGPTDNSEWFRNITSLSRVGSDGRCSSSFGGTSSVSVGQDRHVKERDPSPGIVLQNVTFAYNESFRAVDDVCLSISSGEFVALTGPNGAGKTTLLRMINGLVKPQVGRVTVEGKDASRFSVAALSSFIGYLPQDPYLHIGSASVLEEITFSMKCRKYSSEAIQARVEELAEQLDLRDILDVHPYRLGRSALQRVVLASVLACRPTIVLADEPTSKTSYPLNMEIMELLGRVNHSGRTVVVVAHDVEIARGFASRQVVMSNGRIVADGRDSCTGADPGTDTSCEIPERSDSPGRYERTDIDRASATYR